MEEFIAGGLAFDYDLGLHAAIVALPRTKQWCKFDNDYHEFVDMLHWNPQSLGPSVGSPKFGPTVLHIADWLWLQGMGTILQRVTSQATPSSTPMVLPRLRWPRCLGRFTTSWNNYWANPKQGRNTKKTHAYNHKNALYIYIYICMYICE